MDFGDIYLVEILCKIRRTIESWNVLCKPKQITLLPEIFIY